MAQTNQSLSDVPFLRNLATSLNVASIPLAIFLLILICIVCIAALVVIILCAKSCIRRAYMSKPKRKRLKAAYLDEILDPVMEPGMSGLVTYEFHYDVTSKIFQVTVVEGKNLVTPADSETLDVYVSVLLLKQTGQAWKPLGKRYKSEIQRHTKTPRWNYSCNFSMTENDLKNSKLIMEVFDYDNLGQDRCIGRLEVPIGEIHMDEYVGTTYEKTACLRPGAPTYKGIGEICVGLAYLSNPGCIEVFVYEARKLDIQHLLTPGKSTLSVQVDLKHRRKTLGTFETKAKEDSVNPYFNARFSVNIKPKYLDDASVIFSLKQRGSFGRRSVLGRSVVGPNSSLNTGLKQWDEMRQHSPRTHVMWHVIVPNGGEYEP
ncbi:unnamed protein product [Echinostoma caproni]|uniref:C2 domain-containing protein n=1 Tax=Echinostoma caproni TaxID=27848 RepID=A0A183AKT4_9TREM|nr:unnamed protein product [Echinostoma caproni]